MKRYLLYFVFTISCCFSQDATISLLNDSPYFLRVTVQSAGGTYLGGEALQAGEFKQWTTKFKPDQLKVPGTPNSSLTPFTVIWRCEHGGFYSVCNQASPGSLIRANICPGAHYCAPKEKESPPPECECIMPECPKCPDQK
jgi:hypothetical protein